MKCIFSLALALLSLSVSSEQHQNKSTSTQHQPVQAATGQSDAMERSIKEANRLASAMEGIAKDIETSSKAAIDSVATLRERTAQQMRAYLTVIIGGATYQERAKGWKFEGKPLLVNTGHTPARNVSYRASAAILSIPIPDNFDFPLTAEVTSTATVGAQQNAALGAIVDEFVDDAEVDPIRFGGRPKCLYVWGVVTYDDIFGDSHVTKFCQSLFWTPDGKGVYGYFFPRHNEST